MWTAFWSPRKKKRQEDDASTFLAAANEGADWLAANADAEAEEIHEKRGRVGGAPWMELNRWQMFLINVKWMFSIVFK